tara:strand:+ start:359 stop:811 length:453 start_codon:yes stop_codon:yes gene_type:complete
MTKIKHPTDRSLLFIEDEILGKNQIDTLKNLNFSETGTRRLCFHSSNESPLHVMAVQALENFEYTRHAHVNSDELIVVVQGKLRVRVWSTGEDSEPQIHFLGNDLETCDCAAICIPMNTLHDTMVVVADTVYLESKLGPFQPESTVYKAC